MTNKKAIAQSFRINPIIQEDLGNYVYKYYENWIYEAVDKWDDFCIDSLYKEYQKLGITKVFVINKEEFKKFILWALPEYEKRFNKGE